MTDLFVLSWVLYCLQENSLKFYYQKVQSFPFTHRGYVQASSGCLKPQIIPNPIATMFSLIETMFSLIYT